MIRIRADLHIHSCLSPCASLELSPSRIVELAVRHGIKLIALTDHHSSLNCPTIARICAGIDNIRCLYGMEITTQEEAHVLALFDDTDAALEFGKAVFAALPVVKYDPDRQGDQVVVDENEIITGGVENYIGGDLATSYSLETLIPEIHSAGGLAIPSHIDRPYFSIMSQIGYLPEYDYDAIEVTKRYYNSSDKPDVLRKYPLITNSDAHAPEMIGTNFHELEFDCAVKEIGIDALRAAFQRRVVRT
ncbi:MAG: PHP domain-containing protein [Brevinematales bacterium]|nr:PHP domain-containing protein [Brevinematales bacterium]